MVRNDAGRSEGWNPVGKKAVEQKPLEILGRNEWSALQPRWTKELELPVAKVFLQPTSRPACYEHHQCVAELQKLQEYHLITSSIPDIRFNFLIAPTGVVYEGRGWTKRPSLPSIYRVLEHNSLLIAFIGDFRDYKVPVPATMLESMELLFKLGLDYKYISPEYETFDI